MSFLKIKNLSVDYPMRKETVYAAKNVNIEVNKGEILGLVERSSVSSAAFTDVRNFHEAEESTEIADINKRDKTFTAHIGILGFLENLRRGQSIIPAIPPIPGIEITPTFMQPKSTLCQSGFLPIITQAASPLFNPRDKRAFPNCDDVFDNSEYVTDVSIPVTVSIANKASLSAC